MSVTLTDLIPDLYVSLDVISREMVGMIPSVSIDAQVARAAIGQQVRTFVAPASTADDIIPGVIPPDDGDQAILNRSITVQKSRRVPIRWTGENDRESAFNAGSIRQQQIQQAMRTLVNEIEADLYTATALKASRMYRSAAPTVTPFRTANEWTDAANVRKVLMDNGSPLNDISMVMDTATGASLRGYQAQVNTFGSDQLLRQGVLLDVGGMALRESAAVSAVASSASGLVMAATGGEAAGATSIAVTEAEAGDVVLAAGDLIEIDGHAELYMVVAGSTVSTSGTVQIEGPGLSKPLSGGEVITVAEAGVRNVAFQRGAVILASRLPSVPEGGDLAQDRTTITDPRSGLSFEVAMYPQYRQMQWEISAAWGVGVIKPEHVTGQLHSVI